MPAANVEHAADGQRVASNRSDDLAGVAEDSVQAREVAVDAGEDRVGDALGVEDFGLGRADHARIVAGVVAAPGALQYDP